MARIKVTGYIDTNEMPHAFVDLTHEIGLSNEGYEALGVNAAQFVTPDGEAIFIQEVEFVADYAE